MDWKTVAKAKDLIVLEKELQGAKLKIEARKNFNTWEVFKTKVVGDSSNLISQHFLENKKQAIHLIERLKTSDLPTKHGFEITIKRAYKEEFVEKWFFNINDEPHQNFMIIKYDDVSSVDLVMHERYRYYQSKIIGSLEEKLGLEDINNIKYAVHYFRTRITTLPEPVEELNIEFDLDDDN